MIQEGEKSTEEQKKFALEGVKEVVRYCQNDIACRRVQVLRYFGQVFESAECYSSCNNCLDSRQALTVDLTNEGIELLFLIKSFGTTLVTKAQCLDAFRGTSSKALRDKGIDLDSNPRYGGGKELARDQSDRLMDHLLIEDALEEFSSSRSGQWNNMYIKVSVSES